MKWHLLAAVVVCSLASAAHSAEPRPYAGANWWARYGAPPVNQQQAPQHVSTAGPPPVVVEPGSIATYEPHGIDYVYYPGICDYTPPCTEWLWNGYTHNPRRCHPHCMQPKCRYGAGNCGSCGNCTNCNGQGSCSTCGAAPAGSPVQSPAQSPVLKTPQPLPDVDSATLPLLGLPRINVR